MIDRNLSENGVAMRNRDHLMTPNFKREHLRSRESRSKKVFHQPASVNPKTFQRVSWGEQSELKHSRIHHRVESENVGLRRMAPNPTYAYGNYERANLLPAHTIIFLTSPSHVR